MESAAAMPAANSGPLPPNANSTYSRGSRPRSVDTDLIARIMLAAAIWCAPYAACSTDNPSGRAILCSIACRAIRGVERKASADEIGRIEIAQHDVGVGDRGILAALVVANGSGCCARAVGADPHRSAGIDPDDRAAAGADLGEIDRGHLERVPAPVRSRDPAITPPPTSHSCTRVTPPSSISEALAVVPPMSKLMTRVSPICAATTCEPMTPPAGPDSTMCTGSSMAACAVVSPPLDCMSRMGAPIFARSRLPRSDCQIARDHGLQIRVHHRGRGALVFLDLGQDLVARAYRHTGRQLLDDALDRELVRRVGERVEKADRNRLDVLRQKLLHRALGVGRIERRLDAAVRVDPLVHGGAKVALDQGRRFFPAQVVKPRHAQRADVEHVAKAGGPDEARARAFALQDRVGADGRAVPDLGQVFAVDRRLREHVGEAVDDGAGVVVDARRNLLRMQEPVARQKDDVGESAADVDADTVGGACAGLHVS